MLADILPTGYEVGVLNGQVRPGDVVAVVGAGPIGLAAIIGARLYSPATSSPSTWPTAASRPPSSSAPTHRQQLREDPSRSCRRLTGGLGADVAIEAVGVPATFELATPLVRPGGHVANIGVHGEPGHPAPRGPVDPQRDDHDRARRHLLDPDPAPARRQPANSTPSPFVTHHFTLDQFEEAYDVFGDAADTGALKVVLTAT